MPKTYAQAIEELKDEAAEKHLALITQEYAEAEKLRAAKILGGIVAIGAIARNLSAHALRGLQTIEQENLYKPLGYANFVAFLNSDESPLSKTQYYERMKVLENEGDVVFDALNGISIPISKRKLLGKGNLELRGSEALVTVTDSDGHESQATIPLTDRAALLNTLSQVADTANDLRRKSAKLTEKLERGQKDYDELRRKFDAGAAAMPTEKINAHAAARLALMGAFTALLDTAKQLTDEEAAAAAPHVFESIAARMNDLRPHYRRAMAAYTPDGEGSIPAVAAAMRRFTDDDLDELFD